MKQIFHPYTEWEDYQAGMWRSMPSKERDLFLQRAIDFTGDAELYGSFMMRVIEEWPISCEHNLTDLSQNRKAWIGHAACCMAIDCPENVTREAWGHLNQEQQDKANNMAILAINKWEQWYEKTHPEHYPQMGIAWLSW